MVATTAEFDLELPDGLNIQETIKAAFSALGENGLIRAANSHSCPEIVQAFRRQAEWITGDDPAATVGVDENQTLPHLEGQYANRAAQDAQNARRRASEAQNVNVDSDTLIDHNHFVNMVVVDGIVMGPTVFKFF